MTTVGLLMNGSLKVYEQMIEWHHYEHLYIEPTFCKLAYHPAFSELSAFYTKKSKLGQYYMGLYTFIRRVALFQSVL